MDSLKKSFCIYVAYLRALYLVHQNAHWTCSGPTFFALHQLFEKLYLSAQDNGDDAAEKVVGLFGSESLTLSAQTECMGHILGKCTEENLLQRSLKLEEEFLAFSKKLYETLKNEKPEELTLGLDDLIMSICNDREEAVYHLRQTLRTDGSK